MFAAGNFILQKNPPSRDPVWILVPSAPDTASWTLSHPEIAELTKTAAKEGRVEFRGDGSALLTVESGGQVLLRVSLKSQTFSEGWQVTALRVTETGESIDMDGHVKK